MSENIPESIPTSQDSRSRRPVKRARGPPTAISAQSNAVEALFDKQPDIQIPSSALAKTAASLPPPPEIVTNVQGSSAGAGSGEFHVYKASRRREFERVKLMEEEARREEDTKKWAEERERDKKRDDAKLDKNRAKREKAKLRKMKAKSKEGSVENEKKEQVSNLGPNPLLRKSKGVSADDEENEKAEAAGRVGITIHDDD